MNDYGMGEFFRKSLEVQQNMAKTWMDMMSPRPGGSGADTGAGTGSGQDAFASAAQFYQNMYESWQKQFMDNPWMKLTPWSYNMFNSANPAFDMFNKMMNSGKWLTDLSGIWQQLVGKDPFASRDEILKFIEENKNSFEKLVQDTMNPFIPDTMRPLVANAMDLVKQYEALGKDVTRPWMELGPKSAEDFKKIMEGDATAYSSFYKSVNQAYEESFGKIFNASGMGLTREQQEAIMSQFDSFFKMFIALAELMSLIGEVSKDNMVSVIQSYEALVKEGKQPQSLKEFYDMWVRINEDSFVKVFGTPQFSQIFCEFAKRSCEFKIHFDKVLEQVLGWAPFAKNSDMASLYKTVYDLRKAEYAHAKEMTALREELQALKTAVEQLGNARKGDK